MDLDFGYDPSKAGDGAGKGGDGNGNDQVYNVSTGKMESDVNGVPADDITHQDDDNPDNTGTDTEKKDKDNPDDNGDKKDKTDEGLIEGTSIEVGDKTYTADKDGNLVDADGNIFKKAEEVSEWLKEFDKVEDDTDEISINSVQEAVGVSITDDNDKPIEFDNTPEGIAAYVNAVIETARDEHYGTAINTLYQKYPILNDVLNYYLANGNSLEGFNEVPDRSGIVINDTDEAQQETIIKTAWKEQGRKGDVDSYIQYLKSSGTLLATAKEELAGLQEADAQYRKDMEEEAERKENERIAKLEKYWNGVHDVIKSRNIAGYQIPETIVINRDGQKISATPEDFYNYIYRVDSEGYSAYERALAAETPESRRDDEILRAYLKFVGGNYSNLVGMAINKEKVATLRLKAKERNATTVRITKPKQDTKKGVDIDLGYN